MTILLSFLFLQACSNVRYLKEGEVYYKETQVTFTDSTDLPKDLEGLETKLAKLSKLSANSRVLGIYPVRLWLYNLGDRGFDQFIDYGESRQGKLSLAPVATKLWFLEPNSGVRNWLINVAGNPPSLIDSLLLNETQIRMENYLYNRGYFYPYSEYEVNVKERNQRATVDYKIDLGKLYVINDVIYELGKADLQNIALRNAESSLLKKGQRFDVDFLKNERQKLTENLTNNGYYVFNKEYIYFEVDSTGGNDSLDIYIKVAKPENDSIHRRYLIRDIYIIPDVRDLNGTIPVDTTVYNELTRSGQNIRSTYKIIQSERNFTEKSITNNVFFNVGDYYSQEKAKSTIGAFSNLGMFKYSTIQTKEIDTTDEYKHLDLIIRLEPLKRRDITLQFDASTTSEYLFANYANTSYSVRNEFKRLDILRFTLNGGVEFQINKNDVAVNTTQFSAEASLQFPRFFWPFSLYTPKNYYPRTIATTKFEYLDRIQFYRLINTAFTYGSERFEGSKKQRLSIVPIDVNYVRLPNTTVEFDSILDRNFLIKQSFQEQFILAPNLTYIFNQQAVEQSRNSIYFRGKLEVAGSLFFLGNALSTSQPVFGPGSTPADPYTLLNLPFSNYTRLDLDLRNYLNFKTDNSLAARVAFGIAKPYWNSEVVPFVKQFYVGGANSIRAFPIRKVGPGNYLAYNITPEGIAQPVLEDQTGDVKIEFNVEYRFDIAGILKGAVFCDGGNVWTLNEDELRPGSQFNWNNFYRQLALGPGAGLRLDFTYFVIRFDGAYPLIDPGLDGAAGKAAVAEGNILPEKVINWNFAIGYPF